MTPANNWTFVAVAYVAVWLAIGGYWLYVHRVLKVARARYERAMEGGRSTMDDGGAK